MDNDRSVIQVAFSETRRPLFASGRSGVPNATDGAGDEQERSVEGRLAVVTGASGLLGATVAAELARRGAHVCLIGRDLEVLRDSVDALPSGARSAMLRCDLASVEDITSATDFVDRMGAPVDLLVHAAGMYSPADVATGSVEDLDEHYLLDVRGPYLLTQRLLPSLRRARGRVVVFSVGADGGPVPGGSGGAGADVHRTISQAGLLALASGLRDEVAGDGVRVLAVRTDDGLDPNTAGPDQVRFLEVCAAKVLDTLAAGVLDVTELHLRRGGHRTRSERR